MSQRFVRQTGPNRSKGSPLGFVNFAMIASIGVIMLGGSFLRPILQKRRICTQMGYIDELLEKESSKQQNVAIEDYDFNRNNTMRVDLK